jgi:hypothetical protein
MFRPFSGKYDIEPLPEGPRPGIPPYGIFKGLGAQGA